MKYLENNTIVNTPLEILNTLNSNGNTVVINSISAAYTKAINDSTRKVAVYNPPGQCQGILPDKKDNFDLTKGLGQNHLSSIIDQLNAFKENQLQNILTKIQAMGPENSKDIKLAAGIIDTINKVRQYATCYSNTVIKINSLVDAYLAGIDKMVNFYQSQYNTLLNTVTGGQGDLLNFISKYVYLQTYYDLLKFASAPLDILAATNLVANDIVNAYNLSLLVENHIEQSVLLRANAYCTLLQNDINNLIRVGNILTSLNSSRSNGANMYMVDDYLNDVSVPVVEAASYSFSLTNSADLTQYSFTDDRNILSLLSTTQDVVLIDARQQIGTIIVPSDTSDSLISCGLDIRAGFDAQLSLILEIDDGNTVIQATSNGVSNGDGSIVNKVTGIYINLASEKDISYTSYTVAASPANSYVLNLYSVIGTYFNNNQQFVDSLGNIFQVVPGTQTSSTITVQSISTGNPAPPDPTAPITYIDSSGATITTTNNVASLKNNAASRIGTVLHAGEQISCKNWSLYAKAFGNSINPSTGLAQQLSFIGPTASLMFLKAAWGFVPA